MGVSRQKDKKPDRPHDDKCKKYKGSIIDTKVYRGADIGSDHYMVMSKIKLKLQRTNRKAKVERERFNIKKLQQIKHKKKFKLEIKKWVRSS